MGGRTSNTIAVQRARSVIAETNSVLSALDAHDLKKDLEALRLEDVQENPLRESSVSKGKGKEHDILRECLICREDKSMFDTIITDCQHIYCRDCLLELFSRATIDRELFPPRCCTVAIPLAQVQDFFTNDFIARFREKTVEFTTPNPLYGCERTCSAFIRPDRIRADTATAVCPKCSSETCATCRQEAHTGRDCLEDESA